MSELAWHKVGIDINSLEQGKCPIVRESASLTEGEIINRSSRVDFIDFHEVGKENPAIPTSLIALLQLNCISLEDLQFLLNRYSQLPHKPQLSAEQPLTDFFMQALEIPSTEPLHEIYLQGIATRNLMQDAGIGFSDNYQVLSFFDSIVAKGTTLPSEACNTIRAFVDFYNGTRTTILHVGITIAHLLLKIGRSTFSEHMLDNIMEGRPLGGEKRPEEDQIKSLVKNSLSSILHLLSAYHAQYYQLTGDNEEIYKRNGRFLRIHDVPLEQRRIWNDQTKEMQYSAIVQDALYDHIFSELESGIQFSINMMQKLGKKFSSARKRIVHINSSVDSDNSTENTSGVIKSYKSVCTADDQEYRLKHLTQGRSFTVDGRTISLYNIGYCPFFEEGWEITTNK